MRIEKVEQVAALIITAGLVLGNFVMFTPWRNDQDPRNRHQPPSLQSQPGRPSFQVTAMAHCVFVDQQCDAALEAL